MPKLQVYFHGGVPADIAGTACPVTAENIGAKIFGRIAVLTIDSLLFIALARRRQKGFVHTALAQPRQGPRGQILCQTHRSCFIIFPIRGVLSHLIGTLAKDIVGPAA